MRKSYEQSRSVWMDTAKVPLESSLAERVSADVCVIGAGIAGMSTAYLLALSGQSVVVLDDGAIGGGMTGRTTAHLVNALDDRYFELERLHGEEGSRLAAQSHTAAIDQVEAIVKEEGIECEFERLDGYLFVPPRDSKKILDDELEAVHRAGLTEVEKVERVPWESYDTGAALRFPMQAQFHPLKYLAGLAKAIKARGGHIYTETHATEIEGGKQARIGTTGRGLVTADAVVVATNTPVNDLIAIHTKQAPYQTYVIGAGMTHGTIAGILLTDLILGRKNPWESIYDPSRITLKALPEFAKENLNVAVQYTDLVVAGDVESADEVKPGGGAIILRGLSKVAVYRDPQGQIHELSAVCKHLGCIVKWNSLENTWDCPCHGSRYDALGKVIQGPANSDLSEMESTGEQTANSRWQTASGRQ